MWPLNRRRRFPAGAAVDGKHGRCFGRERERERCLPEAAGSGGGGGGGVNEAEEGGGLGGEERRSRVRSKTTRERGNGRMEEWGR